MDTLPFLCTWRWSRCFSAFQLRTPWSVHELPNSNNNVITATMSKVKADWKQTLSSPSNISLLLVFPRVLCFPPLRTLRLSLSRGSTNISLHLTLRSISITLSGDYSPGEQDVTGYRLSRRTASLTICLRHVSRRRCFASVPQRTMSVFWGGAHHSLLNLRTGIGRGRGWNIQSINQKGIWIYLSFSVPLDLPPS